MRHLLTIVFCILCSLTSSADQYSHIYLEAVRQQDMGNYISAYHLFRRCLETNPQAAEAHYGIANFHMALHQDSLALVHFKQAAVLEPENTEFAERLAQLYVYRAELDSATAIYERLSNTEPDRTEFLEFLIRIYDMQKDYPKMLNTLTRLETREGQSEAITLEKMQLHTIMGDTDAAYAEIKGLVDAHPYEMSYRVLMGNWLQNNGRKEEALKVLDDIIKEDPSNAEAQLSLLDYHRTEGHDAIADSLLFGLLVNPRTEAQTRTILLREWMKQTPVNERRHGLKAVLNVAPENLTARLELLQIMWNDSIDENVVRECRKAVEYTPNEPMLYYYLGVALSINKHYEEAVGALQRGVSLAQKDVPRKLIADMYCTIGDAKQRLSDINGAFEAYDSCLVYNPDHIMCLNNYAYFLSVENRNLDKAAEMSYKAITAEATNPTYLDTYAWILYQQGRYEEAKIYMDMTIKYLDPEDKDNEDIIEHSRAIEAKLKK